MPGLFGSMFGGFVGIDDQTVGQVGSGTRHDPIVGRYARQNFGANPVVLTDLDRFQMRPSVADDKH
jgi:hypothetical protein